MPSASASSAAGMMNGVRRPCGAVPSHLGQQSNGAYRVDIVGIPRIPHGVRHVTNRRQMQHNVRPGAVHRVNHRTLICHIHQAPVNPGALVGGQYR